MAKFCPDCGKKLYHCGCPKNYYKHEGYNPEEGEPVVMTDEERVLGMNLAGAVADQIFKDHGLLMLDYVGRVLFLSLFATAYAHGMPHNLIMNDFERRVVEVRERLMMLLDGRIKLGEVGPPR